MLEAGAGAAFVEAALASATDECILWPYAKVTGGYGITTINGKSVTTHRYVCEQTHGPSDLLACHKCGVPACLNPRHIRWGTHKENAADMSLHGTSQRGETNVHSKLTEPDVRAIKRRLSEPMKRGDVMRIARQYKVDKATICDIAHGRTWGHLT